VLAAVVLEVFLQQQQLEMGGRIFFMGIFLWALGASGTA
jgi:hypothetical protein